MWKYARFCEKMRIVTLPVEKGDDVKLVSYSGLILLYFKGVGSYLAG